MPTSERPYERQERASQIDLGRIIGTKEAAAYLNLSVQHFRRLAREGKVPAPVRLSARKLGWRIGALVDFTNQRAA